MTAPVSLAEARKLGDSFMMRNCPVRDCERCTDGRAVLALVELAEAYLAVRDLEDERERERAEARLALAAKGVTP